MTISDDYADTGRRWDMVSPNGQWTREVVERKALVNGYLRIGWKVVREYDAIINPFPSSQE